MKILEEISTLMQQGRAPKVKEAVCRALEEEISPSDILENALMSAMAVVGEKFKNNEIFVPEVLIAARAMNAGVEVLKPHLLSSGAVSKGKVILGTVKGDLHDIGKNLVKIMLEGKGIEVIDLGVDVEAKNFVDKAIEHKADAICCSALLTTTMVEMKNVVNAANEAKIRDKVKILVGGAPVTGDFCESIGADFYTPDAASASDKVLEICSGECE